MNEIVLHSNFIGPVQQQPNSIFARFGAHPIDIYLLSLFKISNANDLMRSDVQSLMSLPEVYKTSRDGSLSVIDVYNDRVDVKAHFNNAPLNVALSLALARVSKAVLEHRRGYLEPSNAEDVTDLSASDVLHEWNVDSSNIPGGWCDFEGSIRSAAFLGFMTMFRRLLMDDQSQAHLISIHPRVVNSTLLALTARAACSVKLQSSEKPLDLPKILIGLLQRVTVHAASNLEDAASYISNLSHVNNDSLCLYGLDGHYLVDPNEESLLFLTSIKKFINSEKYRPQTKGGRRCVISIKHDNVDLTKTLQWRSHVHRLHAGVVSLPDIFVHTHLKDELVFPEGLSHLLQYNADHGAIMTNNANEEAVLQLSKISGWQNFSCLHVQVSMELISDVHNRRVGISTDTTKNNDNTNKTNALKQESFFINSIGEYFLILKNTSRP